MRKYLLLMMLAVALPCFSIPIPNFIPIQALISDLVSMGKQFLSPAYTTLVYPQNTTTPLDDIKQLLEKAPALNPMVIDKVLTSLTCAHHYNTVHNDILTIIDYSLPASDKRLWVFDLKEKKLLFHTYVSHGIKSGTLFSNYFSNKYNSRASSIGIYKTEQAYYGREGLSLRLDGLDRSFNDNASGRSVVMHPAWYVEEAFIKKYGRSGRSWGCPALPLTQASAIINTIKDNSLFVIYYPSDQWFLKSKFLNCEQASPLAAIHKSSPVPDASVTKAIIPDNVPTNEARERILFIDLNNNNKHDDGEPVVTIIADNYLRLFHTTIPLERMIRRQVSGTEYVALSRNEFQTLVTNRTLATNASTVMNQFPQSGNSNILNDRFSDDFNEITFVIPVLKMRHGYHATEMKILNLGTIQDIKINNMLSSPSLQFPTVYFQGKPSIRLKSTNQFIRWLGL